MRSNWLLFSDKNREAVQTLMAFLHKRLSDRGTVDWALSTKPTEIVKRIAVLKSLEFLDANDLKEPWYSAWRLIEESWNQELPSSSGLDAHRVGRRINAGDRSRSVISAIIAVVQPNLEVSTRHGTSKRPRRVEDLLHASLASQDLVDLSVYRLDSIQKAEFLVALGIALEGTVNQGIAIGRSLGWEDDHKF